MRENKSLELFLLEHLTTADRHLANLIQTISFAARITNDIISRASISGISGLTGTENKTGDVQQKLDLLTNECFLDALIQQDVVCGIVSEENEEYVTVPNTINGKNHVIMLDPLDGSSNIDVNGPIGTIFSVYKRKSNPNKPVVLEDFLQKGREQVMAGYIIYGPATTFVFTTGNGVYGFTLNPSNGIFYLTHPEIKFPETGGIYSINEGNYLNFSKGVKDYLDICKNKNYTSRYIGALVADFHRNLLKGGIYLYPGTSKIPQGKIRLLYECNPIAFICEQAGGYSITDNGNILDIDPTDIHQQVPFYCGSKQMIETFQNCLTK